MHSSGGAGLRSRELGHLLGEVGRTTSPAFHGVFPRPAWLPRLSRCGAELLTLSEDTATWTALSLESLIVFNTVPH